MYESKDQPLLSRVQFYSRLLQHVLIAILVIIGSMLLGMLGFVYLEQMHWHDAFLHSLFMLGGLGALSIPASVSGKIFLSIYSLYVGLVFAAALGIMFAPIAHRILHTFHLDTDN